MRKVESSLPIQRSHPPSEPDAQGYRLALLWTGDAAAAGEILRAIFSIAPEELGGLRGKERRQIWMIRQIRTRAAKWQQANQAAPAVAASFPPRVASLPEPSRSAFALFHCLDCSLEDLAEMLGLSSAAFAQALARARQELAPGAEFPENALLRGHRPWGGDRSKVAKAVRAAQAQPETLPKLAAQIAADLQWHEATERIEIPEALALLNLAEPPKLGLRGLVFQPAVLAIALALAVVVGVGVYLAQTRMGDFPGKEAVVALVEVAGSANGPEFEEISPTEAGKLDDWFVLKGFEGYAAPRKLRNAKVIGCRVFKQDGVLLAEVEFEKLVRVENGIESKARMLVFRAGDLKNGIEKGRRHIFQQEEWAVAAWSEEENCYVVMFQGDSDDMPGFLRTVR